MAWRLGFDRIVESDTLVRWHRLGFNTLWRWRSRHRLGRPGIARDKDHLAAISAMLATDRQEAARIARDMQRIMVKSA
jgi:hypothetical protein